MRLRDALEYGGYRILAAAVRTLPLGWIKRFAAWIGRRLYLRGGKQVRSTDENLRIAYPDLEAQARHEIAVQSYVHFSWNVVDFLRSERWTAEQLCEHVSFIGKEHIDAALAHGKGVLLVSLHLGNFELAIQRVGVAGIRPLVIGRPLRNEYLYARIRRARTRFGAHLVDRDSAVKEMLRTLRKNGLVAVLNDQYVRPSRGVFAPFLGARASTHAGVAMLALRTGAKVVTGHALRDGEDHHTVYVFPGPEVPRTGDRKRDIEAATAAYNAALERFIREHPEQWMWGHRRFRHSPDLEPNLYARARG